MNTQSEETQFALLNQKLDNFTERFDERLTRLEKISNAIGATVGLAVLGAILSQVIK